MGFRTLRFFTCALGALTLLACGDNSLGGRDAQLPPGTDGGSPPGTDGSPPGDMRSPAVDAAVDLGPPVDGPEPNRFGIGFVGPGNETELELSANLTGPGGHVKLIFPDVVPGMTGPREDWVAAVRGAYERDLIPVVRFGPPWGDRRVRNQSDAGSDGLRYTELAQSYVNIIAGLPLREGWPFYVEVHNEPNLCYEWMCDRGRFPDDRIPYARVAEEYASLLRDVTAAVHARFDRAQVKVANGGLAPGGTRWCECIGAAEGGAFEPGITSREFLGAMASAVPGVFDELDAFASHSYPAEGEGWGFFVPYAQSLTGLRYYQSELAAIGRPGLGVLMTETGWRRDTASDADVAMWTRQAYENVWLTEDGLIAIMPFILLDVGGWDHFAWVDGGGNPRPVYDEIRALRCSMIGGRC